MNLLFLLFLFEISATSPDNAPINTSTYCTINSNTTEVIEKLHANGSPEFKILMNILPIAYECKEESTTIKDIFKTEDDFFKLSKELNKAPDEIAKIEILESCLKMKENEERLMENRIINICIYLTKTNFSHIPETITTDDKSIVTTDNKSLSHYHTKEFKTLDEKLNQLSNIYHHTLLDYAKNKEIKKVEMFGTAIVTDAATESGASLLMKGIAVSIAYIGLHLHIYFK